MKVLVIGATGRVGKKLVKMLSEKGHVVYAGARKVELIETGPTIYPIFFDLKASVEENLDKLNGIDAVYFVAGSRGKDLLQSDLFGAVKLMEATEKSGIKRFIQLSSIFALEPNRWNESGLDKLTNYNIAKFFSDRWLVDNTALDYTILQPGALEETEGTGLIEVNVENPGGNSIDDVVHTLVELLDKENTFKKVIKMHNGNTPIKEAIERI